MNRLPPETKTGTLGELLVQLRLLECDVQAAPPLKDSGNDLIAAKGRAIRAIQVKTTTDRRPRIDRGSLPDLYDILALVQLAEGSPRLRLDACRIFLLSRAEVQERAFDLGALEAAEMTEQRVADLFANGA